MNIYLMIGVLFTIYSLWSRRKKLELFWEDKGIFLFGIFVTVSILFEIFFWPAEIAYFFWQECGEDIKYILNGRKSR